MVKSCEPKSKVVLVLDVESTKAESLMLELKITKGLYVYDEPPLS